MVGSVRNSDSCSIYPMQKNLQEIYQYHPNAGRCAAKVPSRIMLLNMVGSAMRETKGARTRGLCKTSCFSRSLSKGANPLETTIRGEGSAPLMFVKVTWPLAPKDVRGTQARPRRRHVPHVGLLSSHFFLRVRQVTQPVLDFNLSMLFKK